MSSECDTGRDWESAVVEGAIAIQTAGLDGGLMPDFTCQVCGDAFSLPQEVIDRYPGWKPRFCRRHKGGKASSGKSGSGRSGASKWSGGGGKSSGSRGSSRRSGGGGRGGKGRSGSLREENLPLADVLARYSGGPDDGIFTDGSCSPNPGPGGWGVAWLKGGELVEHRHGHDPATTNNRMELLAIIEALKLIDEDTAVIVFSDSNLCVQTLNQWAAGWERRGWKRKAGPIKNLELVQEAYGLKQSRPNVKIEWIAAHTGYLGNELADSLATAWMRSSL